jgi:hypothetical protein
MTRSAAARQRRSAPATKPAPAAPPLAPRPRLFAGLLLALVLWLSALLTMYFLTVYPQRKPASTTPAARDLAAP